MADEKKAQSLTDEQMNAAEMPDGKLNQVNGGESADDGDAYTPYRDDGFGSERFTYIHQNCGGRLKCSRLLGFQVCWQCDRCYKNRQSLQSFDYYIKEFQTPMSDPPVFNNPIIH